MRKFRPTLVAVALALASGSAAAQFSGAYVFGDSLSDAGQYGARFTTNPGLTFPMYVTQQYGISVTPSFTGGTDYAQGGARVNAPSPLIPPNAPNISIAQQVSTFLAKGPLDPNALYQLQGGPNDILVLASQAANGQITPAQLQAGVAQAAVDLVAQAARLQAAGARYLVVYNIPDVGLSPSAGAENARATFTSLASLFNSTLNAGLSTAGLQVVQVNAFKLLQEVVANPAAYGFSNVTDVACTTSSSLMCTPSTLVAPNAALTYAFADGVHPTTGLALIGAQAAISMIEGPTHMAVLAEAPLGVEEALFRTVDARMMSGINSPRPVRKYEFWAAYDYGHNDFKSQFIDGNADLNSVSAGGDVKLSDKLLVGGFFGYTENKGDFGGNSGNYKLKELSGTIYAGYGHGPWYVGGTIGAGDLDYSGIRRNITLGPLTRTETSDARGWQFMASVLGGYWFNTSADLQHGPFVRVAYQEIRVHGFTEAGADSTALSYGEQKRDSLVTSLGWQLTGRAGMFRPFARVTWENESRNSERTISATPVGFNTTYTVPGFKPDNNWVRYVLGASADFGGVTGFITGTGTGSKGDGDYYGVTVGLRVPL
ncbi:MAG: autotransporter domain-containing protein [Casimicrobiaceae bacterium]